MTAISSKTRAEIKGYLEGFIKGLIDEYKGRKILKPTSAEEYLSRLSSNGELKPFQAALIPPELIRINQFERGLSTKLGNSFEECARLIALEHHQDVRRGYDIKNQVDEAVVIENEFWNIVGGATAYEELLEIYLEVGREKSKYMLDTLAFGF
jgi:hypothetical protein